MRVLYILICGLLTLEGASCAWGAAEADGERDIPEIPTAQRIYRERQPQTYEEVMEAVENIAESRIAYNAQLQAYLKSADVSQEDKEELVARFCKTSKDMRLVEALLTACDADIQRWQNIIKDQANEFRFLSVVESLWLDREEEKITRSQKRTVDSDIRESIYLTECYLYLKSLYNFKFSMQKDVTNAMLSPGYFTNLKDYLLGEFKEWEAYIERFQGILSVDLQKKFSFLKQRVSCLDMLMTADVEEYAKNSQSVTKMKPKAFLKLSETQRQEALKKAGASIESFAACVDNLAGLREICSRFLLEIKIFGQRFFQKQELEKNAAVEGTIAEKEDSILAPSEQEVPVSVELGAEEKTQEVLPVSVEEEEDYPQTREDWKKLNEQFFARKAQKLPQAEAAPAADGSRFDEELVAQVELFLQEFIKARAFKYEDIRTVFNLLDMTPQIHGHNNLSIKIPKKIGNGVVIRFYDKPHGTNEGHNAFWRWALRDGFREAGWIQP
jgi:hypothetical protein